jgi:hypothetical protein
VVVVRRGRPRCAIFIVMGKTDPDGPRHSQQSMVLVPRDTPGVTVLRPMHVFGYDDAPHGHMEIVLENVRVPASNILLGEGRGFEIAQGRLGPGRIHHCMRSIGAAERALETDVRAPVGPHRLRQAAVAAIGLAERIAESRCMIDQARLLTLNAAHRMDVAGNKVAKAEIAMIKVVAPNMSCKVVDWAIQAHGAAGVSQDFWLAEAYAHQRTVRIVDGPDEVHRNAGQSRKIEPWGGSAIDSLKGSWARPGRVVGRRRRAASIAIAALQAGEAFDVVHPTAAPSWRHPMRHRQAELAPPAVAMASVGGVRVAAGEPGVRPGALAGPVAWCRRWRAGAPQPDIGTEAALRAAVLAAPSIGYSTGPSGTQLLAAVCALG